MDKIVKFTILIVPLICSLYMEKSHADNNAQTYTPSSMWQALLDADKSHIFLEDPLAQQKLRRLIESS